MALLSTDHFKGGWYELPGPANFWPDNFDFNNYGWVILSTHCNAIALAKDVFNTFAGRKQPTMSMIDLMNEYFSSVLGRSDRLGKE